MPAVRRRFHASRRKTRDESYQQNHVVSLSILLLAGVCAGVLLVSPSEAAIAAAPSAIEIAREGAAGDYRVLSWNDLGMHCYNPDFQDIGVLPPWNTLWAQVIRVGDPPQVVTAGITVTFFFTDNTYSVGKSDFWDTSLYPGPERATALWFAQSPAAERRADRHGASGRDGVCTATTLWPRAFP